MTRDEIIKMAESCSAPEWWEGRQDAWHMGLDLERFAALVAAAEREACKDACTRYVNSTNDAVALTALNILDAIRARDAK